MTVPVYNLTDTWNAGATVFTAIGMNVTNTASAAASLLMDLQIGGNSKFNVDLSGGITMQGDTSLERDAANVFAQRNGANAQTFRVYNTFTDASNYERGVLDWSTTSNTLTIGTQNAGTGSGREVWFVSNGGNFQFRGGSNNVLIQGNLGFGVGAYAFISPIAVSGVLGFGTASGNTSGWIQWGGQARVTSDFTVTSSTALVNVTGLSVNVAAGRTYSFDACLMVTDAAAGGVQAAIAGTATATAIQYIGYTVADNAIKGKTNATALATAVGSTTTTETAGIMVVIKGTITVNAAGTLTVQMAQNTSNGTATTAKRGSYFIVHDMP